MSGPAKLHLSLSSQSEVQLDLCEGFSGNPQLTLRNEGAAEVTHYYPFHAELERNNDRDGKVDEMLDLGQGLGDGDLAITDESGRQIPLKHAEQSRKDSYYELMSILPGHTESTYGFRRISPELLDSLGRRLVPGRSYRIGFSGQSMGIRCEVGEENPETHQREEATIEPAWDPQTIPFTVVAGTRKPRFTMSITAPSSICHISGTPAFPIVMAVTSLERRPVTVNVQLDDFVKLWPETPAHRWGKWGSHDLFRITRDSDGRECILNANHPPEQAPRPASDFQPENGLLEFTHGTTHTYHFHLGQTDLSPHDRPTYIHHEPYTLTTKPQGFSAWDYGTKAQLLRTHRTPSDWCEHGPIVFEPVCDVALTVRAIMEREAPMPFARLPPEIRQTVYAYLRYASCAGKIRFIAHLGC